MPKYYWTIAVADEPESHRKNEGDVVSISEDPRGRKIMDEYLILPVDSPLSLAEIRKKRLRSKYYEGGLKEGIDFDFFDPYMYEKYSISTDDYPSDKYVWKIDAQMPMLKPQIIGKNRYFVPFSRLGNIKTNKIRDKYNIYQPFMKASFLIQPFINNSKSDYNAVQKANNRFALTKIREITKSKAVAKNVEFEVDCSAPQINEEDEVIFIWDSTHNLIMDRHTNQFVSPEDL